MNRTIVVVVVTSSPSCSTVFHIQTIDEAERERLFAELSRHPRVHFEATVASNKRIDDINILQASLESMAKSVAKLKAKGYPVDYALIDGNRMPKW